MTQTSSGQVFSKEVRSKHKIQMQLLSLGGMLGGMILVIVLLEPLVARSVGLYLVGLFIGFGFVTRAIRDIVQMLEIKYIQNLRPLVRRKVEALHNVNLDNAIHVGYSPGDTLRSYNGDSCWDIGFLVWEPSAIHYLGDITDFALQGSQISSVDFLGSSPAIPMAFPKLVVSWTDQISGQTGKFQLEVRDVNKRSEAVDQTIALAQKLESLQRDWLNNQQASSYTFTYRSDVQPPAAPEVKPVKTGPVGCLIWIVVAFAVAIFLAILSSFLEYLFGIKLLDNTVLRFVIFFMIMMVLERLWLWFRTQ